MNTYWDSLLSHTRDFAAPAAETLCSTSDVIGGFLLTNFCGFVRCRVLNMEDNGEDFSIVGHMGKSAIMKYSSGHRVAYLDRWRFPNDLSPSKPVSRRLSVERKLNISNALPTTETTTAHPSFLETKENSFARLGYIDVMLQQAGGLSETGE